MVGTVLQKKTFAIFILLYYEGAMSHYKHLTLSEREKLMYFLAKGCSMRRIAKELGRSASTISRELKRNSSKGEYLPEMPERKAAYEYPTVRPGLG